MQYELMVEQYVFEKDESLSNLFLENFASLITPCTLVPCHVFAFLFFCPFRKSLNKKVISNFDVEWVSAECLYC